MFFIRYWLKGIQRKIQWRAALVLFVIHAGLILSVMGLSSAPREQLGASFHYLLAGVIGLYGGIFLGAFFVFWPLYNMLQKARYLMRWREWIWDELPKLIAYIPTMIEIFRSLRNPQAGAQPSPAPDAPAQCNCPHCQAQAEARARSTEVHPA